MSSDQKGKYGLQNAEKYFYLNQVCCFNGFRFWQKDWKLSKVQIPNNILIASLLSINICLTRKKSKIFLFLNISCTCLEKEMLLLILNKWGSFAHCWTINCADSCFREGTVRSRGEMTERITELWWPPSMCSALREVNRTQSSKYSPLSYTSETFISRKFM